MKINYEEFINLKKLAINCLSTPNYVRYRLNNKKILVVDNRGYYVYEKM